MTEQRRPLAPPLTSAGLVRITLVVSSIVILILLLWRLADVLLLVFAAILLAIVVRSLSDLIQRWLPLPEVPALITAGLLMTVVVAGFLVLLGAQLRAEFSNVVDALPGALASLGERIGIERLDERLAERAEDFAGRSAFASEVASYTTALLGALASLALVVAAGMFLAAHPRRHKAGFLQLLPAAWRPQARQTLASLGYALQQWLLGQLIAMLLVGSLTTAGLYAIGMPSAAALGFLAGIAEFVPIVGPAVSAVPAVLLAVSQGGSTVLWVIALYAGVQLIEGNLIMPLIQRRTVDLPPVLTLFAVLALGMLFGPLGVLLGTPLAVVLLVVVKQLYVEEVLDEDADVPGDA